MTDPMTPLTAESELGPCIETDWRRNEKGYGTRSIKDATGRFRHRVAHRVAWEEANGPIPAGLVVMHLCDNPPCIRVSHLRVGTHAENIADRDAKGRTATGDRNGSRKHPDRRPHGSVMSQPMLGTRNGQARLDPDRVRRIREASATGRRICDIAADIGVDQRTIRRVLTGENWSHV